VTIEKVSAQSIRAPETTMCGILVQRLHREPARREVYATALGRMVTRGPDHEGFSED